MRMQLAFAYLSIIILCNTSIDITEAAEMVEEQSIHFGLMHPNGVDLVGYSVEKQIAPNVFRFYSFGIPSLAAIGFTYYEEYKGSGISATAGVGIGFVMYGSMAYQLRIEAQHYLKFGVGLVTGVAYSGMYPVVSYEYRFKN